MTTKRTRKNFLSNGKVYVTKFNNSIIQKTFPTSSKNSISSTDLSSEKQAKHKRKHLIIKTLAEDYPGLDYLGFHSVLKANYLWYKTLWFTIVTLCFLIGLLTIYRIINEYITNPSATSISVKSVEKLLLPQLTVCATHAATINLLKLENQFFANQILNYKSEDVLNFAYYMLSGSGFQKMNWKNFNETTIEKLSNYYNIFRGPKLIKNFFEEFMNKFGLQCDDFLQDCRLGDEVLNCCEIFKPVYLIRRGRCFRSIKLYQKSFDELGKLRVSIRKPVFMDNQLSNNLEILAFITEHKAQIAPFPRYYLYPKTYTKARIFAKKISLLPKPNICNENTKISKDTCYIEKWLRTKIEIPFNCTYPYMHHIRNVSLNSCDPSVIVNNYKKTVEAPSYTSHSCILACERWEYSVVLERTSFEFLHKNTSILPFTYRIDISYNDLQYEEIQEVNTVTLAGLIAQIGGQLSLFLGSSILNLTQMLVMLAILIKRILFQNKKQTSKFQNNKRSLDNMNLTFNQNCLNQNKNLELENQQKWLKFLHTPNKVKKNTVQPADILRQKNSNPDIYSSPHPLSCSSTENVNKLSNVLVSNKLNTKNATAFGYISGDQA